MKTRLWRRTLISFKSLFTYVYSTQKLRAISEITFDDISGEIERRPTGFFHLSDKDYRDTEIASFDDTRFVYRFDRKKIIKFDKRNFPFRTSFTNFFIERRKTETRLAIRLARMPRTNWGKHERNYRKSEMSEAREGRTHLQPKHEHMLLARRRFKTLKRFVA